MIMVLLLACPLMSLGLDSYLDRGQRGLYDLRVLDGLRDWVLSILPRRGRGAHRHARNPIGGIAPPVPQEVTA